MLTRIGRHSGGVIGRRGDGRGPGTRAELRISGAVGRARGAQLAVLVALRGGHRLLAQAPRGLRGGRRRGGPRLAQAAQHGARAALLLLLVARRAVADGGRCVVGAVHA